MEIATKKALLTMILIISLSLVIGNLYGSYQIKEQSVKNNAAIMAIASNYNAELEELKDSQKSYSDETKAEVSKALDEQRKEFLNTLWEVDAKTRSDILKKIEDGRNYSEDERLKELLDEFYAKNNDKIRQLEYHNDRALKSLRDEMNLKLSALMAILTGY